MDKTALLSMFDTREFVTASRRKESTSVGGNGQLSSSVGTGEPGGMPCALATRLAAREDIDNTLRDQRPPYKPPDLPQCYASDLKVRRSHKEAMRSEYAYLLGVLELAGVLRIAGCGDVWACIVTSRQLHQCNVGV